jgi:hypothetical protein
MHVKVRDLINRAEIEIDSYKGYQYFNPQQLTYVFYTEETITSGFNKWVRDD